MIYSSREVVFGHAGALLKSTRISSYSITMAPHSLYVVLHRTVCIFLLFSGISRQNIRSSENVDVKFLFPR